MLHNILDSVGTTTWICLMTRHETERIEINPKHKTLFSYFGLDLIKEISHSIFLAIGI